MNDADMTSDPRDKPFNSFRRCRNTTCRGDRIYNRVNHVTSVRVSPRYRRPLRALLDPAPPPSPLLELEVTRLYLPPPPLLDRADARP